MWGRKNNGQARWLLLTVVMLSSLLVQVQANPRYAAIIVHADSGEVLHSAHANAPRYPASLTKMMTLYLLFDAMEQGLMTLDTAMPVSAHAASMPQTNISLKQGDRLRVRDAIPALVVRSANDAAVVVAEALGGTESEFAVMMTNKAKALNMTSTTFRNASGLPDAAQKSSAKDLSVLALRLMKDHPNYYHYFSTLSFTFKGKTYHSHNRMIKNYAGTDGMKTGYIRASGFNVATSSVRNNQRLIGVVMGGQTAQSRDAEMVKLLDAGFVKAKKIAKTSPQAPKPDQKLVVNTKTVRQVTKPEAKPAPKPEPKPIVSAPKPAPPVTATPAVARLGQWAVQVGSFRGAEQARERAHEAARRLDDVKSEQVAINEVQISNNTLYRAQLVGLQQDQAKLACERLTRQGIDCLVVRNES